MVGRGEIDVVHDQDIIVSELRLGAGYSITDRLGLRLMLPLRLVNSDIVYLDATTAEPVQLVAPDVHHRNETLVGIGDPWLLGRMSQVWGGVQLEVEAGLSVPVGRTEEDPFRAGDLGVQHQHVQFGTGTVNPIVGLAARRAFGRWIVGAHGLTQQVLYENAKEYQAGDRYAAGVSLERVFGTGARWRVRGGLDFQKETAERWHGALVAEEGNRGREDVLVGGGVAMRVGEKWAVNLGLKVPLVVRTKGEQVSYPAILEAGVGGRFELGGGGGGGGHAHSHEDGHDHGDEHDHGDDHEHGDGHEHKDGDDLWKGVDVASVSDTGEAVELVGVPGKITVFDFWAPWCKPCKRLDALIAPLARAHPGRIAIRKLNVVDWDTPAAARYLEGYDLPHLKVYDASGNLLWERSGNPEQLELWLRTLLAP